MSDYLFFETSKNVEETYGDLPHWNQGHKIYFVTFRLADSLPLEVLQRYEQECLYMERVIIANGGLPEDWKLYELEKRRKILEYLDQGYGRCLLKRPDVRQIVRQSLAHVGDSRCVFHDYVIMPNHLHLLVELNEGESITKVMGSVKGFTAFRINQLLGEKGKIWQHEIYDRIIRNVEHYNRSVTYIARNPRHCAPSTYSLYLQPEHESLLGIKSVE